MTEHDHYPDDPLPGLIAGIDQMLAIAPHLARTAMGFYEAFRAEGFTDSQAVYLAAVQLKDDPGTAP